MMAYTHFSSKLCLILGGTRSGKSRYGLTLANQWAETYHWQKIFVATAEKSDPAMTARIACHQDGRDASWQLAEIPTALDSFIRDASADSLLLIDCMTLWLNNILYYQQSFAQSLVDMRLSLQGARASVIMVSHELGHAPHHHDESVREFVDFHGEMNQTLAEISQTVYAVTAGIATMLKSENHEFRKPKG